MTNWSQTVNHYVKTLDVFKEESMTKTTTEFRSFAIGSWERPDAGGIVRRGEAAEFVRRCTERYGEPPECAVGIADNGLFCYRESVMEVYGLPFCEAHGEEAASGALEELYHSLELLDHNQVLGVHERHALHLAMREVGYDSRGVDALLIEAFPLDEEARERVTSETLSYLKKGRRENYDPPYDDHLGDRLTICRHMRRAFEDGATWLVELLEEHRENSASQAAYALALEKETGLR